MEDQNRNQLLVPPISDRWKYVLQVRCAFAGELDQIAKGLSAYENKRLRSLSRWFKGPAELENALQRPDVMAICLPLVRSSVNEEISSAEIVQAARLGFCSMDRTTSVSRRVLRRIVYPILILAAVALLGIGFSFWIAPQFEEMFEEFGIELPSLTMAVLGIAQFVRRWWWILFVFPIAAALFVWFLNRPAGDNRAGGSGWVDQQMMSTRNSLASWAWHIALLLEAGLSQSEAIKNAGIGAGKVWLQQSSIKWAENNPKENDTNEQSFFTNPKFQMLNRAMQVRPSAGKVALLREVAAYYRDRNRTIGDWWVQWLVTLMLFIVGVAICFAIVSLFMPLIAIVSGLTGNK